MNVTEQGFYAENIVANGNKFLVGNGYLGYRGTLDEFTKEQCVGLNVAGLYDGVKGKWRETVNAFNPFFLQAQVEGVPLDVRQGYTSHKTELDCSRAVFSRETQFDAKGAKIILRTERFVSMARKNLLCSRIEILSDRDVQLVLFAGVDPDVWDINGPHLVNANASFCGNRSAVCATTQEKGLPLTVACKFSHLPQCTEGSLGYFSLRLCAHKPFVLDRIAWVLVGDDKPTEISYQEALWEHTDAWQVAWKHCGVEILDNDRANLALQYSIYHLVTLAPKTDCSIAARGLSGQTYKGAVFWDTEIYLLPFYLHTMPSVAKELVQYRVDTLSEAMKKARHYGYGGAFYAWESQEGVDACSDFNVVDAFSHRPVRTYFKDKQIHISADVAYAVLQYYRHTGDVQFMLHGGLQTVLQCAEFARTYSYFNHNKNRYELLDVIGPDEYHERVNNNAFTNYTYRFVTEEGVLVAKTLKKHFEAEYQKIQDGLPNVARLAAWAKKLYLPQPNEYGVIEQFDGYFNLEDVSVQTVRNRLVLPNEYWGGSTGVATATRVIKQADVIVLFNMFPHKFPEAVQRANYNFYLPYTEHGSSLSRCAYALTACRLGEAGAYESFLEAAEIDLKGGGKQWAGDIYIGGTHPAASGGAWQTAVLGFAGMSQKGGKCTFKPNLPTEIGTMQLNVQGQYKVKISHKRTVKQKL